MWIPIQDWLAVYAKTRKKNVLALSDTNLTVVDNLYVYEIPSLGLMLEKNLCDNQYTFVKDILYDINLILKKLKPILTSNFGDIVINVSPFTATVDNSFGLQFSSYNSNTNVLNFKVTICQFNKELGIVSPLALIEVINSLHVYAVSYTFGVPTLGSDGLVCGIDYKGTATTVRAFIPVATESLVQLKVNMGL